MEAPDSACKPEVLVADDDATMRILMREALAGEGFVVREAENGAAALEAVRRQKPDILLLDLMMPEIDGFAVLAELRGRPETSDLPISVVTCLEDTGAVARAYAAGATDFLAKPVHWPNLGNHIRFLLRSSQTFRELRKSRAFYHAIAEDIPLFICRWSPDGIIRFVNDACCRYFERDLEELTGRTFLPMILEGDREKAARHFAAITPQHPVASHELRVIRGDGEIRWHRWTDRALFDENGTIREFQSIGEDITERKQTEEKLLLAGRVFEHSDELIAITDQQGSILDANPAFCRLTGYDRREIIGRNIGLLKLEQQNEQVFMELGKVLREAGRWRGEIQGRRKNGEVFTCLMTINTVRNEEGETTHLVNISTDISQFKEVESQLRHLAFYDPLTDLPNRTLLQDRLQQSLHEGERAKTQVAVLFLDLDKFKDINDSLGHQAGDRLLIKISRLLRQRVRRSDTLTHLSGDEFIIVMRNVSRLENVAMTVEKHLSALARPFELEGREIFLGASVGIALYPGDGETPEELIKNADLAMYHAKRQGGNRYQFFSEEMNARARLRLELKTDLRHGLERDEFTVFYQPKIAIGSGRLTGLEALLRWEHPQRGLVPPSTFIPLAEETGLIVPIGAQVMRIVCNQMKTWREEDLPALKVAVNLSAVQLRTDDILSTMQGILRETVIDPRLLELEITESVLMEHTEKAVSLLNALRKMGMGITMDDFGTGYSSLSYLKRFPVESLKIDRSFIAESLDTDGAEIIRAIIAMAHRLGLKVIAEGVETKEQLEFLLREGCDEAQGYYFAQPMPAREFVRWFSSRELQ